MIEKLQFISNQTKDITHLESIQTALDAGCRWIQLRVKNQSFENVLKLAENAKILCDSYQAKLIINDFPFVAKEIDAYGLHLGLDDMSIETARKIVGKKMIIGGTANTLEHILKRIKEGADYIGLGPFRFTSTKQNLSPILGLEGYQQFDKIIKRTRFINSNYCNWWDYTRRYCSNIRNRNVRSCHFRLNYQF